MTNLSKENFITFPIDENKKPLIKKWNKLTKSSRSKGRWGVLCGKLNNLTVVDIDISRDGLTHWNSLIEKHGEPKTTKVLTPSGGFHYYFNYKENLKNWVRTNTNEGLVGIDIRTEGGYVCGFGSKGYTLVEPVERVDMPTWLYDFLMRPYTTNNEVIIEDTINKVLEEWYKLDESNNFKKTPKSQLGNIINFRRICESHCSICDKKHGDNTAQIVIFEDDDKAFYGCSRSNKMKFLCHISNKEEKNPKEKVNDTDLLKKLNKENFKKSNWILTKRFENLGTLQKFNERYCSKLDDFMKCQSNIQCIKSNVGTGKTNALAEKLKIDNPDYLCLLTFRTAQVEQLKNDKFKDVGLVAYNDKTSVSANIDNKIKKIIIQTESLGRLKWNNFKSHKHVLVCDEIQQIKKQFTSETFMKQPKAKQSWKKFKQLIKYSAQVYIMDAHLDAETVAWIKQIRGNDANVSIFWNEWKADQPGKLILAPTDYDIIDKVITDLLEGKKCYLACNGATHRIDAYAEYIRQKTNNKIKILVIHKDTIFCQEVQDTMLDINKGWAKYNLIITSPTIQSGLSFDTPDVFHTVYGIFGNFTSSSYDCIQMLNRIRNPISPDKICSLTMKNFNVGHTNKKDLIQELQLKTQHIKEIKTELAKICDYEILSDGNLDFDTSDYFNLWVQNTITDNINKTFFKWCFLREHKESGYHLEELKKKLSLDEVLILKNCVGSIIKLLKEKKANEIAQVITLSDIELEKVKKKLEHQDTTITNDDILNVKKDNILKHYDIKELDIPTQEKNKWFLTYSEPDLKKHYTNQRKVYNIAGNWKEKIFALKSHENRLYKSKMEAGLDEDVSIDDIILQSQMISIHTKWYSVKWELIFKWLQILGIDSMNQEVILDKLVLKNKLIQIQSQMELSDFKIMGYNKKRIENVKSLMVDDKNYIKRMLEMINGIMGSEFGISIGKEKTGKRDLRKYKLHNKILNSGFITTEENTNTKWIPYLARTSLNITDMIDGDCDCEEYDEDDRDPNGDIPDSDDEN